VEKYFTSRQGTEENIQ